MLIAVSVKIFSDLSNVTDMHSLGCLDIDLSKMKRIITYIDKGRAVPRLRDLDSG